MRIGCSVGRMRMGLTMEEGRDRGRERGTCIYKNEGERTFVINMHRLGLWICQQLLIGEE